MFRSEAAALLPPDIGVLTRLFPSLLRRARGEDAQAATST